VYDPGVRAVALVLPLCAFACSFEPRRVQSDPGPDGNPYVFDASLADAQEPDAPAADAGEPDARGNGIACMSASVTCSPGRVCCVQSNDCTYDALCGEPGSCLNDGMVCDGPEDCPAGESCCGYLAGGGFNSHCAAACGAEWTVCHGSPDCGGGVCCFNCGTDVGLCNIGC
jgi:hypothetical protein